MSIRGYLLLSFILFCALGLPSLSDAQAANEYHYSAINDVIAIQPDSTFDVIETQTYVFNGSFHEGDRVIPLNKFDYLDEVNVTEITDQGQVQLSVLDIDA